MLSSRSLIALMSLISISIACSCTETSPEQIFCLADYVSKVRVDRVAEKHFMVYHVEHLEIFKQPENATLEGKIRTPLESATCGVQLSPNQTVVLAGDITNNRLFTNLCATIDPAFDTRKFMAVNCTESLF